MPRSLRKIKPFSPLLLFLVLVLAAAFLFRLRSAAGLLPRLPEAGRITECQILRHAADGGIVSVLTDDPERIAEVLALLRDTRVRFSGLHLASGLTYDGGAPYHLSFFNGPRPAAELIVTGDGYILAGRRRYRILPPAQEELLASLARRQTGWAQVSGSP